MLDPREDPTYKAWLRRNGLSIQLLPPGDPRSGPSIALSRSEEYRPEKPRRPNRVERLEKAHNDVVHQLADLKAKVRKLEAEQTAQDRQIASLARLVYELRPREEEDGA
jgi:hypothetical protein